MRFRQTKIVIFAAALACGGVGLGCGGSDASSSGSGGSGSGGKGSGGAATGGASGPSGSGGAISTGGSSSTGGVAGTGGSSASGGATAAGGAAGTGGAAGGGAGATATGGTGGGAGRGGAGSGGVAGSAAGGRGGGSGGSVAAGGAGGTATRSMGCGKAFTRPDVTKQITMTVAGVTRYYLVYLPTTYNADTAMPVIFAFHGHGMNNIWSSFDTSGGFSFRAATKEASILVFPHGNGDPPGNTCQGCSTFINTGWDSKSSDLQFFDMLLAEIESKYCVDTHRVFTAGFSQGASFVNDLGCLRPGVIRAVAPVEGGGPAATTCDGATDKVSAVVTHGTGDTTVAYAKGQATAEFWRSRNGCGMTPATAASPLQGCVAYKDCMTGLAVDFCTHSGGHTVPSNGGSNMWNFFKSLQ